MKAIFYGSGAFMCAGVAWFNLVGLVATNPNYDHQWWKVGLACIGFVAMLVWLVDSVRRHDR